MQVSFYILNDDDDLNKMTYACRLVQKACLQGNKIICCVGDQQQGEKFNAQLWTFSQGSFIPHVWVTSSFTNWQDYPVQISHVENADIDKQVDQADLLLNLSSQVPPSYARFNHVVEFVGQEEQDKTAGRKRFRFYRDQGLEPITHKVSP